MTRKIPEWTALPRRVRIEHERPRRNQIRRGQFIFKQLLCRPLARRRCLNHLPTSTRTGFTLLRFRLPQQRTHPHRRCRLLVEVVLRRYPHVPVAQEA